MAVNVSGRIYFFLKSRNWFSRKVGFKAFAIRLLWFRLGIKFRLFTRVPRAPNWWRRLARNPTIIRSSPARRSRDYSGNHGIICFQTGHYEPSVRSSGEDQESFIRIRPAKKETGSGSHYWPRIIGEDNFLLLMTGLCFLCIDTANTEVVPAVH